MIIPVRPNITAVLMGFKIEASNVQAKSLCIGDKKHGMHIFPQISFNYFFPG
jgi:hypothetical protein